MTYHKYLYGFWDRVEQACQQSGLSKCEIARRGKFHRNVISSPTDRMMNANTLLKFCAVTGTSADWLLGLRSEQVPVKLTWVDGELKLAEENNG